MAANLLHILPAWSRTMGLLPTTKEERERSLARLKVCATSGPDGGMCENAKQSSFLKIIAKRAHHLGAIYCSGCGCPVNEKSLIKNEKCPLGKWEKIDQ